MRRQHLGYLLGELFLWIAFSITLYHVLPDNINKLSFLMITIGLLSLWSSMNKYEAIFELSLATEKVNNKCNALDAALIQLQERL